MAEKMNKTQIDEQNQKLTATIDLIQLRSEQLSNAVQDKVKVNESTAEMMKYDDLTEFKDWEAIKNLSNVTANLSEILNSHEKVLTNLTQINENISNHQSNVP